MSMRSLLGHGGPTQAHEHHCDGEEAPIHLDQMVPADEQPPVGAQPREAAFHFVPELIIVFSRYQWASPLGLPLRRTSLGRNAHADTTASQGSAKRAAVVSAVCHQLVGSTFGTAERTSDLDR